MTASKLQGIFTPNLVPYTADGGINEAELRRYADWLIDYARARFGGQDLKAELSRRLELLPAIDKIQPPFRAEP